MGKIQATLQANEMRIRSFAKETKRRGSMASLHAMATPLLHWTTGLPVTTVDPLYNVSTPADASALGAQM
jgi:hypothetical protein